MQDASATGLDVTDSTLNMTSTNPTTQEATDADNTWPVKGSSTDKKDGDSERLQAQSVKDNYAMVEGLPLSGKLNSRHVFRSRPQSADARTDMPSITGTAPFPPQTPCCTLFLPPWCAARLDFNPVWLCADVFTAGCLEIHLHLHLRLCDHSQDGSRYML